VYRVVYEERRVMEELGLDKMKSLTVTNIDIGNGGETVTKDELKEFVEKHEDKEEEQGGGDGDGDEEDGGEVTSHPEKNMFRDVKDA